MEDIEEVEHDNISNDQEESGQIASALDNLGFDRTGVIGASGDIDMASPPPEGSSRVTGGILRGRAIGNVLNLPDADDLVEPAIPAKGTVKLFSDLALKPSQHKAIFTFSTRAESSLGPVLERLGRNYSPVRHNNYRIYVHEGGNWNLKGRFNHAIEEDEDISWVTDNGQLTLAVCAEGKDILAAPVGQPVHAVPLSKAATKQGDLSKNELIAILKVPEHLAQTQKNPGLKLNYAKYKACLIAQDTLRQMIKDGTWPDDIKKPSATNVIELFVSKSYWHHYMTPAFHDIAHYPVLQEWLEDEKDGPADEDVWGTAMLSYTFSDLTKEKARRQQVTRGKGKKAKEDSGNKAKEGSKEGKKSKKHK